MQKVEKNRINMFEDIFRRRKFNIDKLTRYGFELKESYWIYDTTIMNGAFVRQENKW